MAIHRFSQRIGCSVSLAVRLHDPSVDRDARYRPAAGATIRSVGTPLRREVGTRGTTGFRVVWTLAPPKSGGSALATEAAKYGIKAGGNDYASRRDRSGFEEDPLPPLEFAPLPGQDAADQAFPLASPALAGAGEDEHVLFASLLARKWTFRWNSHRTPDELEVELPVGGFPLPPDGSLIRSILVEARVGLIDADDWARGMADGALSGDGRPLTLPVADDSLEAGIAGFAEAQTLNIPSGSASAVHLTVKTFDSILATKPCYGRGIETDVPIDEAIARYLSVLPEMIGMQVHWVSNATPPTVGNMGPPRAKQKSAQGKTLPLSPKFMDAKVLDVITDACIFAGVIPRFVGYRLELSPARTLNQITAQGAPRMVLGHNIEDLELVHHFSQAHARPIEVRSINPDTGRVVAARWPHDPNRHGEFAPGALNAAPPSGPLNVPPGVAAIDEKSPEIMLVESVTDPNRLQDIARDAFEERAVQDLTGRLTTKDVATIDGRAQGVADLLSIRAGDAIAIVIAPSVEEGQGSYIQRIASGTREEGLAMLAAAGYRPRVADRLVSAILTAKKPLIYYVREVELKGGLGAGTEIEVQFQNFIEVIDAEYRGKNRGGHRAAAALKGTASFVEKWNAIEQDMLAGDISPEKALDLQKQVGAAERRARLAERYGDEAATDPTAIEIAKGV